MAQTARGTAVRDYDKIYVDGAWIDSEGTGTLEVINSSTEEYLRGSNTQFRCLIHRSRNIVSGSSLVVMSGTNGTM